MESGWWTKLDQLDRNQREVVSLPRDGSYLILGPPGSGKTNLLLLRAAYLYRAGLRDFKLLTFGRVLSDYLEMGAQHYVFPRERIGTYLSWGIAICKEHGFPVAREGDSDGLRRELLRLLPQVVKKSDFKKLDCVLIDEVQDYSAAEMQCIQQISSHVFAVGDERQAIFTGKGVIDYVQQWVSRSITLRSHYRNGLKICRVADKLNQISELEVGLEATSQYDEESYPSSVRVLRDIPFDAQLQAAISEVRTQLVAYPGGLIGVLCPRNVDLRGAVSAFLRSEIAGEVQVTSFATGYSDLQEGKRVIITTLHAAKGLEFRAVHIISAEHVHKFREFQQRVCYMAVTRAKTSLIVYHERALPGFLDSALSQVDLDETGSDDLSLLFK